LQIKFHLTQSLNQAECDRDNGKKKKRNIAPRFAAKPAQISYRHSTIKNVFMLLKFILSRQRGALVSTLGTDY